MREYVVTCCSTADMSRTFMETNEVPFAMFHYQLAAGTAPDSGDYPYWSQYCQ